jgi:hypothetical protein
MCFILAFADGSVNATPAGFGGKQKIYAGTKKARVFCAGFAWT